MKLKEIDIEKQKTEKKEWNSEVKIQSDEEVELKGSTINAKTWAVVPWSTTSRCRLSSIATRRETIVSGPTDSCREVPKIA